MNPFEAIVSNSVKCKFNFISLFIRILNDDGIDDKYNNYSKNDKKKQVRLYTQL